MATIILQFCILHSSIYGFMWLCARAIAKCQHANRVISIIYPKWDQLGSPVKIILAFLTWVWLTPWNLLSYYSSEVYFHNCNAIFNHFFVNELMGSNAINQQRKRCLSKIIGHALQLVGCFWWYCSPYSLLLFSRPNLLMESCPIAHQSCYIPAFIEYAPLFLWIWEQE